MYNIKDVLLSLTFGSSEPVRIAATLLYIIGTWKVLKKSGVKGWPALIPLVREYQISRCAQREPEGRVYCLTRFVSLALNAVLIAFFQTNVSDTISIPIDNRGALLVVLMLISALISFIYALRIFSGLAEIYGRKKIWAVLWALPGQSFIPALIWGFSDEYRPAFQVQDIKAEMARLATHGSADVMDEGLTVNLKERSVFEDLSKKMLLRDIHMSIPQGHMVLLLGGSGAGKSTLVNAINGYEKARAQIMLDGRNLYTQFKKMQYEIGYVPQADMIRGKDTVLNTLLDAAKLRLSKDVDADQRRARVEEVLEIFALTEAQNTLVEKLSGGQRKRLSIAMELISSPALFILDEPDSGLDGVMARGLFQQLRTIADSGKIVIAISHTPDRVIDLFDDVIVLAKDSTDTGRLAWYGSVDGAREFFGRDRMEDIVKAVNQKDEGGDGLADEYVMRFAEVQHA